MLHLLVTGQPGEPRQGLGRYSGLENACMSPCQDCSRSMEKEDRRTGGHAFLGGLLPAFYLLQLLPQGLLSTVSGTAVLVRLPGLPPELPSFLLADLPTAEGTKAQDPLPSYAAAVEAGERWKRKVVGTIWLCGYVDHRTEVVITRRWVRLVYYTVHAACCVLPDCALVWHGNCVNMEPPTATIVARSAAGTGHW